MLSIVALIMEPSVEKAERNHEEENQEKFHILLDLPNELIVKILRYLTLNDLDIAFRELQYETLNFCYLHISHFRNFVWLEILQNANLNYKNPWFLALPKS